MNNYNNESENITFMENNKSHLVEIVKMRTDALINYSNRVWKIFNWFQLFNFTIFGVIFTNQVGKREEILLLAIISTAASILWFVLGVNDFLSMEKHKRIKKSLEKRLFELLYLLEELNEDLIPPKGIFKLFEFNQTKALFIVPIFNSICSSIIFFNNY